MQTIIAYTIIGVAVGYTVYSVVRLLSRKKMPSCGGSCSGCKFKNEQCTMNNVQWIMYNEQCTMNNY